MLLIAERIARRRVLETDDGADIARIDAVDILSLVRVHLDETPDALLLALGGVVAVRTRLEHAGISAEVCEGTDEGVGRDLERKACERLVVRSPSLLLFARVGVDALDVVDVERAGKEGDDGVEQELHALVLVGRTAEHGDGFRLEAALAEARDDLLFREIARLEELLHELIVGGCRLFDELCAVLVGDVHHVFGDGLLAEVLAEVVIIDLRLHADEVDDAAEGILLADGKFHVSTRKKSAPLMSILLTYAMRGT